MYIARYRYIVGIFVSLAITGLYFLRVIVGIRDGMPHIITFSTVLLTVIGLVYSIMTVVQTKDIYRALLEEHDQAVKELHSLIQESVFFCIGVIIISMGIIFTVTPILPLRLAISIIGAYIFFEMVITSIASFLTIMLLFRVEDRPNEK